MERDKIIAVVLIVGFVFLFFALVGVMAITGFVLFFATEPTNNQNLTEDTPAWQNPNANDTQNPQVAPSTNDNEDNQNTNTVDLEKDPVCGNNVKEEGEQCESDSHCSSNKMCNDSCSCVDKPVQRAKVTGLTIDKLTFFCAPDFEGKKGLAARIIRFKNSASTDFSYTDNATITAVTGNVTDNVSTNNAFDFIVKAGKTLDLYGTNLSRTSSPFIFLGSTPTATKITVDFGNSKYIEYEYTLKAQDFANVGCL